jgi:hypothetical protein
VVSADDNWEYGLLPFDWVYSTIPNGTKRVHIVGNFGAKGVVMREKDNGAAGVCMPILDALLAYIKTREEARFEAVDFISKSPFLDFLLLANAPTVVGSVSTFSLAAAWLSQGHVLLPWCHLFGLKLGVIVDGAGTGGGASDGGAVGGVSLVETSRASILTSGNKAWLQGVDELVKVLSQRAKHKGFYHDCASSEERFAGGRRPPP